MPRIIAIRIEDAHPNADCDRCESRTAVIKFTRLVPEFARTDKEYVVGQMWLCAGCLFEVSQLARVSSE